MSAFLTRVVAIKAELGLPESLVGALPIVGAANLAMGMELDESATLPTMVQKLEAALGLQPSTAAAAAAPAPAPAAPAAVQRVATTPSRSSSSTAPGGRSAPRCAMSSGSAPGDFLPPTPASLQPKLTETMGIARFLVKAESLKQIAARQADGDAVPFEQMLEQEAVEVVKLQGGNKDLLSRSHGRTARLHGHAAVDRYRAIDFDDPHHKRVRKTAPKCARQSRIPRPSHGLPPIFIPRRQYKLNQRYMKTCQPTHEHTRVHPIIPIQSHLGGFVSLYPDG